MCRAPAGHNEQEKPATPGQADGQDGSQKLVWGAKTPEQHLPSPALPPAQDRGSQGEYAVHRHTLPPLQGLQGRACLTVRAHPH